MNALEIDHEERLGVRASELRSAKVDVACQLVNGLATKIIEDHPDLEPVDQYRLIAKNLPGRVDEDLQRKLLKKAQHGDTNATTAFFMLSLKSVFSKTEEYLNGDQERDDELVCAGILGLLERLPRIDSKEQLKIQVHNAAREGIVAYLKQNEGVQPGLTRFGVIRKVQDTADSLLETHSLGVDEIRLQRVAQDLVNSKSYPKNGPGEKAVFDYLARRMEEGSCIPGWSDDVEQEVSDIFRHEEVIKQMDRLPEREQQALKMWVWEDKTFEEIGDQLGFTRQGVRGILERALRKLRHPSISRSYR